MKRPRRSRPRKRTLLMVLLLLAYAVGGAIINVAVAWGLARQPAESFNSPDQEIATGASASTTDDCWFVHMTSRFGRFEISATPMWLERKANARRLAQLDSDDYINVSGLLPSWSSLGEPPPVREHGYRVIEQARGWPMLAMRSEWQYWSDRVGAPVVKCGFDVTPRSPSPMRPIILPSAPLWPGFAINTIFYAAVLWLLFAAPGFVRRRIRARRGQCPACAYPVGASDVCTECGAALLLHPGAGAGAGAGPGAGEGRVDIEARDG